MKQRFSQIIVSLTAILVFSIKCVAVTKEFEEPRQYLEKAVKTNVNCLLAGTTQEVFSADLFSAVLAINLGNQYNDAAIIEAYVLRSGNSNSIFTSVNELLKSPEFTTGFNKKFRLTTEEDGILFRSLMYNLDNETRGWFYKEGNRWYFVKSDFFGDISGYVVTTNTKGQIQEIEYQNKLEITKPAETWGTASNVRFEKPGKDYISESEKKNIGSELSEYASYSFELSALTIPQIDNVKLFNAALVVVETYDGGQSSFKRPFMLLQKGTSYEVIESKEKLLKSELFASVVMPVFPLHSEEDAKQFQKFLDGITEVQEDVKANYKKEDIWFFIRSKSFDELYGYMVKVNPDGSIKYWDYTEISDEAVLKFRMKDPDFKVDYAFELNQPKNTVVEISESENVEVEITFNAEAVNAMGAWILTMVNSEKVGMSASTSMESPFTDAIPGSYLKQGTHLIEYLLLPSGQDITKPLGKVKINVVVK